MTPDVITAIVVIWYALVALSVLRYTEGVAGGNGAVQAWAAVIALFWPLVLPVFGFVFVLAFLGGIPRET